MYAQDYNLDMQTQKYVEGLINDRFPDVKINNVVGEIFIGDLSKMANPRLLYFGHWKIQIGDDGSSYLVNIFGDSVLFRSFMFIAPDAGIFIASDDYFGFASFVNSPDPELWLVTGCFHGFKVEIDTVPAPLPTPTPGPSATLVAFDFVVDAGDMYFQGTLAGGTKLALQFSIDNAGDGCYDPAPLLPVGLTAMQDVLVRVGDSTCAILGVPTTFPVVYPFMPRVNLVFSSYEELGPPTNLAREFLNFDVQTPGWTVVEVRPTDILGVDIPGFAVFIQSTRVQVQVPLAEKDNWTEVKWKVQSPNGFQHQFSMERGFGTFNAEGARFSASGGDPCAEPFTTVYLASPNLVFAPGVQVYSFKSTDSGLSPGVIKISDDSLKVWTITRDGSASFIGSDTGTTCPP